MNDKLISTESSNFFLFNGLLAAIYSNHTLFQLNETRTKFAPNIDFLAIFAFFVLIILSCSTTWNVGFGGGSRLGTREFFFCESSSTRRTALGFRTSGHAITTVVKGPRRSCIGTKMAVRYNSCVLAVVLHVLTEL